MAGEELIAADGDIVLGIVELILNLEARCSQALSVSSIRSCDWYWVVTTSSSSVVGKIMQAVSRQAPWKSEKKIVKALREGTKTKRRWRTRATDLPRTAAGSQETRTHRNPPWWYYRQSLVPKMVCITDARSVELRLQRRILWEGDEAGWSFDSGGLIHTRHGLA